ncbi:hypothetical protein HJ054_22610 [Vibrio parahaemolyticus]|nr:hypothetical protein [Vibrio parahaemolyticus]
MSKILERLSESDTDAFNALYWHIEQVIELESIVAERGKRISVLQKGQLQPKEKDKRKAKEIQPENFACQDLSGKDFQKKELFQANFNKCLLKKKLTLEPVKRYLLVLLGLIWRGPILLEQNSIRQTSLVQI